MLNAQYLRPASLADAAASVQSGGKFLAGGQTLLASMKLGLASPPALVDLQKIPELQGVRRVGDALIVGAMARHAEVATDPLVQAFIPALSSLALGIGDRQVRTMGTIGGSVANNDPSACYPAAVLGLGATIKTDRRAIGSDEFFQGMFTTALEEDEIIVSLEFPVPRRAAYAKFKHPASRFALIGVFVADTIQGPRVAVTGGGNGVFRHAGMEEALARDFVPDAVRLTSVDEGDMGSDLHATAAYRAHLVKVMAARAVASIRDRDA